MASWGTLQPLSPEFYSLLRYGLFLFLLVHLPYIGVLIGGSTVSLLLAFLGKEKRDPAHLRFSRELMRTVWTGKPAFLMFGLAPPAFVGVIYARILFEATPLPWHFWSALLGILSGGFVLLHLYRSAWERAPDLPRFHIETGAGGLLAVILALFLFSGGYGVLFNPEKLPLLREQLRFFLSWTAVVKFLLFLTVFFGMTGGVILLLGSRSAGEGEGTDAAYRRFVRRWGATLAFLAALALPVFALLDLVTLPEIALSATVFSASAAVLLLSLAVCLILSPASGTGEEGSGARVLTLYVLIFLAILVHDHAAVGNAYRDRIAFLKMQEPAAEAKPAPEAPRKEPAGAGTPAEERGKTVFETKCAGCHRFDARVVGPPLLEAVPKYGGDVEKLKGFLRKPVKVDPDYPPMPDPGLPEEEIDAVSRYLIGRVSRGGSS